MCHEDGPRGAGGVGQLLRDEGPAALEVGRLVVDVHGAAGALAGAVHLAEKQESELGFRSHALEVRLMRVNSLIGVEIDKSHLAEELGHDGARGDLAGQRVRVLAVVAVLDVADLDAVGDERRDGLLAVVQMHEATDVALHVGLVICNERGGFIGGDLHEITWLQAVSNCLHSCIMSYALSWSSLDTAS